VLFHSKGVIVQLYQWYICIILYVLLYAKAFIIQNSEFISDFLYHLLAGQLSPVG
jgi:hypothetical protein